ncbi:MAG: hypothetical protein ONB46_15905 [candidate division KSB1 bacterium]|nr:hypothetical protein [candidate division KSB1 bacterium]MDZ7366836.1 hypothetical protein [candidate division KSB1 bacterium]MDZ7405157.1 hypothetical protein [candidate division KSB1 bacterium]
MPVAIKIPPALRRVFDVEAEAAFIDVLNEFNAAQRNGFESTLETHLKAFKEYLDRRLVETDAKIEKRFAEADLKNEKRLAEADIKNEKRFVETNTNFQKRLAEYHASQLRWMFAFFIGNIVTLLGFLLTYMQLIKP